MSPDTCSSAPSAPDCLRFITCGSVDDGKSTLIGRLLWETRQLSDDQLAALQKDSKRHGTQGDELDFALLVDGLSAEREQGITIDVAYRYFSSPRRKFIVADTPGHAQYTRNMVTGASTASLAILLVDAGQGLLEQTKRHAHLVSLMGIKEVVLAINKMDLRGYDAQVFESIRDAFGRFAENLHFNNVTAIPLSALKGDNMTRRSEKMKWYSGPTLIACLESAPAQPVASQRFVFPVQWVNRPHADFRGYAGSIAEGSIRVNDAIRVTSSGQTARVSRLVTMDGDLSQASAGTPVTLCLDTELDISRGDVLSLAAEPLEMSDQFEATLVWMSNDIGMPGRNYELKLASQWVSASITSIKHRLNVSTQAHEAAKALDLNDIAVCNLATARPLTMDTHARSSALGSFILVDRFTHETVAAGMVTHSLRRAQNVHRHAMSITPEHRERMNGHPGFVVWFTGYSGSGKSTVANALEIALHEKGVRTFILDGDNVRHGLNKDLGFTDADRVENIRRVAEVAKLMMEAGLVVLVSFISPFRQERETARQLIGEQQFFEVYLNTSLQECERRDPKGLYKKARSGLLPNMTGINSPYEAPENPFCTIDTHQQPLADCVDVLLTRLPG